MTDEPADDDIRRTAIACGCSDASVVVQDVFEHPTVMDAGRWFVLSVKRRGGEDWELLGRRRTKAELLGLIQAHAAN